MSKKLFPCPVCGRAVSSVLFHANKNKAHQDFIAQQKQLILRLFEDLSFNSFIDLQDRGVYVSYKQCKIYWNDAGKTLEEISARERLTKAYHEKPLIPYITSSSPLPQSFDYQKIIAFKDYLLVTQQLIPHFRHMTQEELNIVPHDFDMRNGVCPICEETFGISFWNHLRLKQHDEQHQKILYQQLQLLLQLFYNIGYTNDDINDSMHFYVSYSTCRHIWKKVFSKEDYLKRSKLAITTGLHHRYLKSEQLNAPSSKWKLSGSNTRSYNPLIQVNWNDFNVKQIISQDDNIHYNTEVYESIAHQICPICGMHFTRSFYDHLKLMRHEAFHNKMFQEQVHIAIRLFYAYDYNRFTHYNNMFLSSFSTCQHAIWAHLFSPKELRQRESVINDLYNVPTSRFTIQGYRKDIGYYVKSSWEANIYRILKYQFRERYHLSFNREIPFDISTTTKQRVYLVDLQDNFGLFDQPGTFIEIKGYFDEQAKYKRDMFHALYPDKKLIFIGEDDKRLNFIPEVKYHDLIKKYKHLIPLWEDHNQNLKTHPWLYV